MKFDDADKLIPTRHSLLSRLKDWNDQESWKVFFDTYWKLIYGTAARAGLSDAEAQDVVQETVISVMKTIPSFQYDTNIGSFKAWLMRLTGWRIVDQVRKRKREAEHLPLSASADDAALEGVVDPAGLILEETWDSEWELNLLDAAMERVKRKVDSKQYQIFDLHVVKCWPVLKVSRAMKVNPGRVYLAKHRIGNLVKKEVAYLRSKPF